MPSHDRWNSQALQTGGVGGAQDGFFVENLFRSECDSAAEALALFQAGVGNKVMASHRMNVASSRSHCVFTLEVDTWPRGSPEERVREEEPCQHPVMASPCSTLAPCSLLVVQVRSRLCLVDLAGSERQAAVGATGGSLQRESIAINKSLFTLRKVIMALAQRQEAQGEGHRLAVSS